MKAKGTGQNGKGGRIKGGRLVGVRKRKRARRGFECEVMALKLRLVRVREERDH